MPGQFHPHRSLDADARIRHIESFLSRIGASPISPAVAAAGAREAKGGDGGSGGGGGGGSGGGGGTATLLAGDVTGPVIGNTVAQLQTITLTLTSPVTGQVLTYNGTAIVNSDTVSGNLTVTGTLATGGFKSAIVTKTGPYTLVYTDSFVEGDATAGPITLTLPTAVGHAGQWFEVKKIDATVNAVTVATTGGQTIDGGTTAVLTMPQTALGFRSDGANWVIC